MVNMLKGGLEAADVIHPWRKPQPLHGLIGCVADHERQGEAPEIDLLKNPADDSDLLAPGIALPRKRTLRDDEKDEHRRAHTQ